MRTILWVFLALTFLSHSSVMGHPGHDHPIDMRIWKDADGLFEIEGSFVLVRDEKVQLRKIDGTLVWIPLTRLGQNDQMWIRNRLDQIRTIQSLPGMRFQGDEVKSQVFSVENTDRVDSPNLFAWSALGVAGVAFLGMVLRGKRMAATVAMMVMAAGIVFASVEMKEGSEESQVKPSTMKAFEAFKDKLQLRADEDFLYVGSNGLPDHPMMIGIKAWQQQVPLPQPYTGKNAWRIPLKPVLADKPISAKTALFRGTIALAVNGVPIFNALNNRGEDAYLAGELDEYGGHCGRGDDYHYHMAPIHLEKIVGKGSPIAFALDGYPLFGYTDADGKEPGDLDDLNGRMEKDGYRYYSTRTYPYINGGMRGVVTVRGDQIEPQPKDSPVRPAGQPLRGARITDFFQDKEKKTSKLVYEVQGQNRSIKYTIHSDNSVTFVYADANGKSTTETYRRREGRDGPPQKKDRPGQKKGGPPPNRDETPDREKSVGGQSAKDGRFQLRSPAFEHWGNYPVEFTGDGEGVSPPLEWSGAPQGTKYFALQLWHKPGPDRPEVKSYWVISNIPAEVTSLPRDVKNVGKPGYNDKNRTEYDPMKSKGPGVKEYHITLYALSGEPRFPREKFNRADLLEAIKDITLAESTLSYTYERKGNGGLEPFSFGLWTGIGGLGFLLMGFGFLRRGKRLFPNRTIQGKAV